MAEIQNKEVNSKGGKVRTKKLTTNVDLTPMVDLGFLLITFFMMTTTMQKPQSLELNMPVESKQTDNQAAIKESKVITIIPAQDNRLYYYEGITNPTIDSTNYSPTGIRAVILAKRQKVSAQFGDADETVVLIKPSEDSNHKNLVDLLDEMKITNVKRFALLELEEKEKIFLSNPTKGLQ